MHLQKEFQWGSSFNVYEYWNLKCKRHFNRGAKTLNTATEEGMIYIEEKYKQTKVGGILQTEWTQRKIGTDNEKSHIVQSHGSRIWYRAYYLKQCSEDWNFTSLFPGIWSELDFQKHMKATLLFLNKNPKPHITLENTPALEIRI